MPATPPLTIVTGFLGSGKTTLLRRLLADGAAGRRLALIVNEFGQVGLDGASLARAGAVPLIELAGGCLCCEAGSDFLVALEELLAHDPQQIVIETSGLAEPGGLIRRVRAAGLALDALVTVADALNLAAALAAAPVAAWQVQAADLLILSKVDLVTEPGRGAAEAHLRALNPRAAIIGAAHGAIAPDLLFGPRQSNRDPLPILAHGELDGFGSLIWQATLPLRRAALEAALASLPAGVYRAKGLVHCSDAPWPDELHFVCGRHSLSAIRPRRPILPLNTLVLIGADLEEHELAIRAALEACADTPERVALWQARYAETWG